ncbi:MAG TPA: metal-dependent transcriptional regulator [Dehalococcoidia bacterium]|nr:metal-dependent transcriptional regulator [Dehalococcoidia bacterium]
MANTATSAHPTETIDDYLQTIYSLETEGEKPISARLARWMNVTPPTAWATVQRMQRDGLVALDDKKVIHLTEHGRDLAMNIARRHRLAERFLTDVLKLGWAEAHREAHHFEHGITPTIEARLFSLLDNPTTCPHGSPIPGTGAKLGDDWVALDTLEPGDRAVLKFISEELEEDSDLLGYLDKHNLKPGREIRIAEKVASTGSISIDTGTETVPLGLAVASRIRALPKK